MQKFLNISLLTFLALFVSGCSLFYKRKDFVILQDAPISSSSTSANKIADSAYYVLQIQPFDVLDIRVINAPESLMGLLNPGASSLASNPNSAGGSSYLNGFMVDVEGNVNLPLCGKVNVRGLSLQQAKDIIREKMRPFLNNAFVEIKFLTFKITVLGAVARPGQITVNNEKASVMDALALAGDFTDFAQPKKIKVLRGNPHKPTVYLLDLTKYSTLSEPGFSLQPNDVIYVEPSKRKFGLTNITLIQVAVSFVNILTVIAVLTK